MTPFYLRERKEKRTIYTLPSVCIFPVLFLIHFRHATYKENVVKNQELFQVCDHFFCFSAVNNKLFDTFLNHNFTVNWNQVGGVCNCAHQFLNFVLLDPYRCSVKVVETWGVERFIQGNLDMYLLTAFWLIDQVKNWDYFDCVCWSCGEVCRVLVSNKVNQIQEVTSVAYRSMCTLIPWA